MPILVHRGNPEAKNVKIRKSPEVFNYMGYWTVNSRYLDLAYLE